MTSALLKEVVPFLVVGILIATQVPQVVAAQNLPCISTRVHLQEREVTVTVYHHEGEEEWAQYLFDVAVEALPVLEELAGFPYPHGFDVEIYPKSDEEMSFFGGENLDGRGIWINRDTFTPETMKDLYVADTVIHESAHYWSDDLIYGKPWMREGSCELLTYLTYQEMGREKDALRVKNEWSRTFTVYKIYNHPLDTFEYPEYGPGDEKTALAYGKSALFCYEIYEKCGLEKIKKINEYLYENHISADSFTYMNLLEEYTGEDQEEFFMEWIFPKKVDLEKWEKAENAVHELEVLTDSSLSHLEEKWGFHKVMDFVEFQIHVSMQIKTAQSYMKEYDLEKALQIISEEIEEVNELMSAFDGYAVQYFEAEKYYKSLTVMGEICEGKLIAAKERLLCFEYEQFAEELAAFYGEMEKLEKYDSLYSEWCRGGCTGLKPLREVLSQKGCEEVIIEVDGIVGAVEEWEVTKKEVAEGNWVRTLGIFLMRNEKNFEQDLENAREEIKNGNLENALGILTHIREELSKTKDHGVGMFFGAVVGFGVTSFLLLRQRKKPATVSRG